MDKQTLKNAAIIINIAASLSCVLVIIISIIEYYLYINGYIPTKDYGFLWFLIIMGIQWVFFGYCAAGIILLIRFLIKNKITVSRKYLLLIPSVIVSIYAVYANIMDRIEWVNRRLLPEYYPGNVIQPIFFTVGSLALLTYYLSGSYKPRFSAALCVLYPFIIYLYTLLMHGIVFK